MTHVMLYCSIFAYIFAFFYNFPIFLLSYFAIQLLAASIYVGLLNSLLSCLSR